MGGRSWAAPFCAPCGLGRARALILTPAPCLGQVVDADKFSLPDSIKNIMDRWTLQMGFPMVTVDTTTGSISQKHFLLDPTSVVDRPSQFQ